MTWLLIAPAGLPAENGLPVVAPKLVSASPQRLLRSKVLPVIVLLLRPPCRPSNALFLNTLLLMTAFSIAPRPMFAPTLLPSKVFPLMVGGFAPVPTFRPPSKVRPLPVLLRKQLLVTWIPLQDCGALVCSRLPLPVITALFSSLPLITPSGHPRFRMMAWVLKLVMRLFRRLRRLRHHRRRRHGAAGGDRAISQTVVLIDGEAVDHDVDRAHLDRRDPGLAARMMLSVALRPQALTPV